MMELQEVTKVYQQGRRLVEAVRGISLCIETGEFVAIMGPSGSGKSTLMHLLGALDTPSTGRALFQGPTEKPVGPGAVALAAQPGRLHLPILQLAAHAYRGGERGAAAPSRRRAPVRSPQAALASLERVGLSPRADHFPEEMSGGEMQRVAVARTLVTEPVAVLCDEPTGNLDSVTSKEILGLLRSLPEDGRRAVVMVTHDSSAAAYGDRLILIRDGLVESDEKAARGPAHAGATPAMRAGREEVEC